jgi:hypothetical protein
MFHAFVFVFVFVFVFGFVFVFAVAVASAFVAVVASIQVVIPIEARRFCVPTRALSSISPTPPSPSAGGAA